jgi:hypothetical protein
MKNTFFAVFLAFFTVCGFAQNKVAVKYQANKESLLEVNGKPFMVNGMNWDYFPIGTNYSYSLWNQNESVIKKALDDEMSLLQNMGVNSIRVYTGIPAKWIEYIYDNYGIYTMLNHSFGRYGLTIDGAWTPVTIYSDKKTQDLLMAEVKKMAEEYKNTRGLLLFLLGNENNYGLFWAGAETEDFPDEEEKKREVGEKRGRPMYKLMNEASKAMKAINPNNPVAICNGDLLFLDIVAAECKDVDVYGINVYRGKSFGDLFSRVKNEYGKPVLLTEFGSDVFNAKAGEEDQEAQAFYLKNNWKEIYENASGLGKTGNSIGGYTFQFSDGWWKFGQTKNLDIHDTNASWSNGGYEYDYAEGQNNMNEEWFGICAKGPTNAAGNYTLYPRAAYYALKEIHKFNPFEGKKSILDLEKHINSVFLVDAKLRARGDKAAIDAQKGGKLSISKLRAEFTTFSTGGHLISTPETPPANSTTFPNRLGFDHMQSFFVGVQGQPSSNMRANVEFNILGNVAQNPIDQIFYENRGRPQLVSSPNGNIQVQDVNRVQLYSASYNWDHSHFNLNGFYRTGHYHWQYEGDFFGLYPEANYGPNMDIYNGLAPMGVEIEGKKFLNGLKLAFGPELWWGANPALLLKYRKNIAKFDITGVFHEDIEQRTGSESSFAVPQPKTRRGTLHIARKFGKFGIDLGGIWAGQPLNGRAYQVQRGSGANAQVFETTVKAKDNWGGKMKMTYQGGRFNWYGQAAAQGLVAGGGFDATQTFTGWRLKDTGSGNQYNVLSGLTYSFGNFQIAPNFLWQRPLEGPVTSEAGGAARPRNILTDPFVVRGNRETVAGELLLTWDPTPGTWMYEWDNNRSEDAKLAVSAGVVFRHLPTTMDAAIGILGDGRSLFAFNGATPAADLWEIHSRIVSKIGPDFGLVASIYGGNAQANGSDARMINRSGIDLTMIYRKMKLQSFAKFNDWGPFDYHRDFNETFPVQLMLDLSTEIGKPDWFIMPGTRIGIRGAYRTLDQFSTRYNPTQIVDPVTGNLVPDRTAIGFPNGNEWEIRTYIHINIGN